MPNCALVTEWLAERRRQHTTLLDAAVLKCRSARRISPQPDVAERDELRRASVVANRACFLVILPDSGQNEVRLQLVARESILGCRGVAGKMKIIRPIEYNVRCRHRMAVHPKLYVADSHHPRTHFV